MKENTEVELIKMVAYLTEKTLNIIKEHTSIPSYVEIKIIPNEFISEDKWNKDVIFMVPTGDKPLKVVFEKR